jgi:hypothetical protein
MLVVVLAVIAVAGCGFGVWMVASVAAAPHTGELDVVIALAYGSVPFAIGTIALGAVAIALAIQRAARDQVHAVDRLTLLVGSRPPA